MGAFSAYVPADRRRALAAGRELPDRTHGAVLFADVSGYTPLTAALVGVHGPRRGAEVLSATLDLVLGAMIDQVEATDGSVLYFSGDALTVWFDGDDGARAVACGDAMQAALREVGRVRVDDEVVPLGLKVAVAAGPARRFVVGDPALQLIDVLAGALLDEVARAEGAASPGDVVVTAPVLDGLPPARAAGATPLADGLVLLAPHRTERRSGGRAVPAELSDELAASWVLPVVRGRLAAGDRSLVTELRRVVPVFVHFGGIDFDAPDAVERTREFVGVVQRTLDQHGGALLQLTIGDKGAYLYGVFGSPVAHEDDAQRAVAACLAVVEQAPADVRDLQVGVSSGRVFSGVQGHARRRTVVCLGDPVNLAARVMGKAGDREVLVTPEVRLRLEDVATVEPLPPVALKGIAAPVTLSRVTGLRRGSMAAAGNDRTPFVGRDDEFATLAGWVAGPTDAGLRVVAVVGGAGVGTTRLVNEVVAGLADRRVLVGSARAFGRTAPYQPWHGVLRALLGLPEDDAAAADRVAERVASVDPELRPRAPLLGPALGLALPDSAVTRGMDARLRRDSREDLVGRIVAHAAAADGRALLVVLEDAHGADDLSLSLVTHLRRRPDRPAGAIVVVGRPARDGRADLAGVAGVDEVLRVGPLPDAAVARLVAHHAATRFGEDVALHPRVRSLVLERAQGNPLTVAELLRSLDEQGADPTSPAAAEAELPAGLEALVLGRIDRLAERERRSVKVASVLLRPFTAGTLVEVHPELGERTEVASAMRRLHGDVLVVEPPAGVRFRHTLTREVAYDSLPFSLRRQLHHRAAGRVLRRHAEDLAPHHEVLAHHTWHAGDHQDVRRFQRLAADEARAVYANEAALTYLGRLVELAEGAELVDALLDRAEVELLQGRLDAAEADQRRALAVAEELDDGALQGRARNGLAETARRHGRLDEALALLDRAGADCATAGDDAGRARSLHLAGTVAAMRGDLDGAGPRYREALALRRAIGEEGEPVAALLTNLGIVAEYDGNLEASARRHREALAVREEVGDAWAMANSRTNLGMVALLLGDHEEARALFEEALRGNELVGDPFHVALGHHNLGNALRAAGELEAAARELGAAATWFAAQDDPWSFALLLEDAAALAAAAGHGRLAGELVGGADALRDQVDAARADGVEARIDAVVADATALVGAAAVEEALAVGRARGAAASSAAVGLLVGTVAGDGDGAAAGRTAAMPRVGTGD